MVAHALAPFAQNSLVVLQTETSDATYAAGFHTHTSCCCKVQRLILHSAFSLYFTDSVHLQVCAEANLTTFNLPNSLHFIRNDTGMCLTRVFNECCVISLRSTTI